MNIHLSIPVHSHSFAHTIIYMNVACWHFSDNQKQFSFALCLFEDVTFSFKFHLLNWTSIGRLSPSHVCVYVCVCAAKLHTCTWSNGCCHLVALSDLVRRIQAEFWVYNVNVCVCVVQG